MSRNEANTRKEFINKALAEDYLVDYSFYQAKTQLQKEGIRGEKLSAEDRNT